MNARLAALAQQGLLVLSDATSHPEIRLTAPLALWQPGLPLPDATTLSGRCRARWHLPEQMTRLIVATERAGNELGGFGGRFPRPSEVTHDIHLAAVYLRLRKELPTRARTWRSEAQLASDGWGKGDRLPDAILHDGVAITVVEFAGQYAAAKLAEFVEFCVRRRMGFEIW